MGTFPPPLAPEIFFSGGSYLSMVFSGCGAITPSLMVVGVWSIDIFSSPIPGQNKGLCLDPPTVFFHIYSEKYTENSAKGGNSTENGTG